MAAFDRQQDLTLTGAADPEQIQGARISSSLFTLLGVKPALGRLFSAEEDHLALRTAVGDQPCHVAQSFWCGSAALGRVMTLNGEPWTVIGVMPRDFFIPGNPAEVWMPLGSGAAVSRPRQSVSPGARPAQAGGVLEAARAELLTIAGRLGAQYPGSNAGWT